MIDFAHYMQWLSTAGLFAATLLFAGSLLLIFLSSLDDCFGDLLWLSLRLTGAAPPPLPEPVTGELFTPPMIVTGSAHLPHVLAQSAECPGVAVIVEALTDNRNRTASSVRSTFTKAGGALGETGSVSFSFDHLGEITYKLSAGDADTVMEAAIEAGADDIESSEDGHTIWTDMETLHEVAKALEASLGEAESVKLGWKPNLSVDVPDGDAETLFKLIDALEDDDDVQTVWGNYEVSDEVMEKLG